jgi:hypothetical protein
MDQPVAKPAVTGNSTGFDLHPFEIKTFEVKLLPWRPD